MYTRLLVFLVFILTFSACNKENPPDCFKSVGEAASIDRTVQDFSGIVVGDKVDLVLITEPGITENSVRISGGKHLLNKLKTEVSQEGILKITDENTCNWVRNLQTRIRVEVHCKPVNYLEINGFAALITPDSVQYDRLDIEYTSSADLNLRFNGVYLKLNHRGAGEITMSGKSDVSVFTLYNVAGVDARNLHSDWAFVYSYSTADTWVRPLKGLGTHIFESGNVFYTLEPWEHLEYIREGKGERRFVQVN